MISLDYLEKQLEFLKEELQKLDVSQRDEKTRAAEKPPAYEITIGGVNYPSLNLLNLSLLWNNKTAEPEELVEVTNMSRYFETSSSPKYVSGQGVNGNAWRWYSPADNLFVDDPNKMAHGPDYNMNELRNYSITIVSKAEYVDSNDLNAAIRNAFGGDTRAGGEITRVRIKNRGPNGFQNRILGKIMTVKKDGVLQDITNIAKDSQAKVITKSKGWTFDGAARSF